MERDQPQRVYAAIVLVAGGLLVAATVALAVVSTQFDYGSPLEQRPLRAVVALLMGAGAIYLAAVYALHRIESARVWLVLIVLTGLAMRAPLFFSQPVQEDDFYRYLWDGGVVAHGFNPYGFAPDDLHAPSEQRSPSEGLRALADEAGPVFDRVNHPELATVYPPTAQAAFAVAHLAAPWNLTAWRAVLLLFDAAALALLLVLLRTIGRPAHFVAIYWWNPVLLKEAYNNAHMDLLVLPFALAACWFALRSRPFQSAAALALAVGAKLWPVLLAPLLIRSLPISPKRVVAATLAGLAILLLVMTPVLAAVPLGERSGFVAYGDHWEMNDALFMGFLEAAHILADALNLGPGWPNRLARAAVAVVVLAILAWLSRRPMRDGADLANRIVIVLGATFMLSPTQFPWYYLWIVPFLALSPRPSLLVLSVMLPVYYLKFYYAAQGDVAFFHHRLVWVEYAPTLLLAATEALPLRRFLAPKPA